MIQEHEVYPFVYAGHVINLGEHSVSSSTQAILEIAKNSYDADARECFVHFYSNFVSSFATLNESLTHIKTNELNESIEVDTSHIGYKK